MYFSGKAKVLGVFGHPVGHSLSPAMHNAAIEAMGLDYVYVPFDVEPGNLRQAVDGVRALGIAGVNVTIPHKEAVIGCLDEVDEDARRIGSVNTIKNANGRLIGSSTDGPGFLRSLGETGFSPEGRSAVVVGAGGAGRAVVFALAKAGARVVVIDQVEGKAERLVEEVREATESDAVQAESSAENLERRVREADLLVNCTPVGMNPRADEMPVSADLMRPDLTVYDLIYSPVKTRLLAAAEAAGARTVNGVKMLVYQGAISLKMWTGIEPPTDIMEAAVLNGLDESKPGVRS